MFHCLWFSFGKSFVVPLPCNHCENAPMQQCIIAQFNFNVKITYSRWNMALIVFALSAFTKIRCLKAIIFRFGFICMYVYQLLRWKGASNFLHHLCCLWCSLHSTEVIKVWCGASFRYLYWYFWKEGLDPRRKVIKIKWNEPIGSISHPRTTSRQVILLFNVTSPWKMKKEKCYENSWRQLSVLLDSSHLYTIDIEYQADPFFSPCLFIMKTKVFDFTFNLIIEIKFHSGCYFFSFAPLSPPSILFNIELQHSIHLQCMLFRL